MQILHICFYVKTEAVMRRQEGIFCVGRFIRLTGVLFWIKQLPESFIGKVFYLLLQSAIFLYQITCLWRQNRAARLPSSFLCDNQFISNVFAEDFDMGPGFFIVHAHLFRRLGNGSFLLDELEDLSFSFTEKKFLTVIFDPGLGSYMEAAGRFMIHCN